MKTLDLFLKIKEAYETSTHNHNRFRELLNSVKWDNTFYAENEYYFLKDDMTFTTPSYDPFNIKWKASAMWDDGSVVYI